jgi:hypothetical protein
MRAFRLLKSQTGVVWATSITVVASGLFLSTQSARGDSNPFQFMSGGSPGCTDSVKNQLSDDINNNNMAAICSNTPYTDACKAFTLRKQLCAGADAAQSQCTSQTSAARDALKAYRKACDDAHITTSSQSDGSAIQACNSVAKNCSNKVSDLDQAWEDTKDAQSAQDLANDTDLHATVRSCPQLLLGQAKDIKDDADTIAKKVEADQNAITEDKKKLSDLDGQLRQITANQTTSQMDQSLKMQQLQTTLRAKLAADQQESEAKQNEGQEKLIQSNQQIAQLKSKLDEADQTLKKTIADIKSNCYIKANEIQQGVQDQIDKNSLPTSTTGVPTYAYIGNSMQNALAKQLRLRQKAKLFLQKCLYGQATTAQIQVAIDARRKAQDDFQRQQLIVQQQQALILKTMAQNKYLAAAKMQTDSDDLNNAAQKLQLDQYKSIQDSIIKQGTLTNELKAENDKLAKDIQKFQDDSNANAIAKAKKSLLPGIPVDDSSHSGVGYLGVTSAFSDYQNSLQTAQDCVCQIASKNCESLQKQYEDATSGTSAN